MSSQSIAKDAVPSTKACVACRKLKTRCIVEESSDQRRCQRCTKYNQECVFAQIQRRKQRKRTDVRVTELEKELLSMRNMLSRDGNTTISSQGDPPKASSSVSLSLPQSPSAEETRISPSVDLNKEKHPPQAPYCDSDLIPGDLAHSLFETYNANLVAHYPAVTFPMGHSVEDLRREKPTLFLAVMAVAAREAYTELSRALDRQVLQSYANRVFMGSEQSMELVQSMILTAVWYSPPERNSQGQHKFYEYIHMAATMAMDLGLGSRPSDERRSGHPSVVDRVNPLSREAAQPDQETGISKTESSRTLLACYLMCSGVALSLRRPSFLRYNDWIQECAAYLQTAPAATLANRRLVAWTRLMSIAEGVATSFSYEDTSKIASIDDPKIQVQLKKCNLLLGEWRLSLQSDVLNGSLELFYHYLSIQAHELALHQYFKPEDFRPPYSFEVLRAPKSRNSNALPHLDSILRCVKSAHLLLETFLHMDVISLRTSPIVNYIRFSYAFFVLEMIASSLGTSSHNHSVFLNRESLQLEHYSSLVIKHLNAVVGPARCKVPALFLNLVLRLRAWHQRNDMQPSGWLASGDPGHDMSTEEPPADDRELSSAAIFNDQQRPLWHDSGSSSFDVISRQNPIARTSEEIPQASTGDQSTLLENMDSESTHIYGDWNDQFLGPNGQGADDVFADLSMLDQMDFDLNAFPLFCDDEQLLMRPSM